MKQATVALAAALAVLAAVAGCSTTRAAGPQYEERDFLMVAEVTATAGRPQPAVEEVMVEAAGPTQAVEEVVVRAARVPVEVSAFPAGGPFVN